MLHPQACDFYCPAMIAIRKQISQFIDFHLKVRTRIIYGRYGSVLSESASEKIDDLPVFFRQYIHLSDLIGFVNRKLFIPAIRID